MIDDDYATSGTYLGRDITGLEAAKSRGELKGRGKVKKHADRVVPVEVLEILMQRWISEGFDSEMFARQLADVIKRYAKDITS